MLCRRLTLGVVKSSERCHCGTGTISNHSGFTADDSTNSETSFSCLPLPRTISPKSFKIVDTGLTRQGLPRKYAVTYCCHDALARTCVQCHGCDHGVLKSRCELCRPKCLHGFPPRRCFECTGQLPPTAPAATASSKPHKTYHQKPRCVHGLRQYTCVECDGHDVVDIHERIRTLNQQYKRKNFVEKTDDVCSFPLVDRKLPARSF